MALDISRDGRRALMGGDDGTLHLIDLNGWRQIAAYPSDNRNRIDTVAFSTDGRFAAAAGEDKTVRVWRLPE